MSKEECSNLQEKELINVFDKPMKQEWWMEYGGFFGHYYVKGDNSLDGYLSTPQNLNERSQCEVEGLIRLLALQPNQRILDSPCGYGRHSIGLAHQGLTVVGVDINSHELNIANKNSQGLENVQFFKQDMRLLKYENEFDAIVNVFFSFGFFELEEENFQVLQNFYQALKPGGKFLMHTDVNIPRVLSGEYKFSEIRSLQNGKKLEISENYDHVTKRINGQWIFINQDGTKEETSPYSVRVYSFSEFSDLCQQVGFKIITGYGNWQGSPLTNCSEDMIIVAEK
ncbi:class I SAM-dependent methyltransferase [Mastigocoleus sp. MO_188.B34]|uniref:SAM-dependent methyltransferase n=1 Tax=Mastigocoleus sp. MO_188.B34 TaxID=3036635 RepID=UPI002617376B|nr:class I SAM-dependent methyltransferase [Mastigocoleus sp. MO_188.B34]MDJ0695422.1 class I SAM-dependent methyltransferase [Mastigocoleus sp. MO_188.B34]